MTNTASVLITGASTGIGATYADRFARRGHNLILVARDRDRMAVLADKLHSQYGVQVEIVPADLTRPEDLRIVEQRLREDSGIRILVNNAGMSLSGPFTAQAADHIDQLVALNLSAVTRLAHAIAPRLAESGDGAIINISSVVGLAPEFGLTVYGATKAFVLYLSQGLSLELAPRGVYVQAVLPAATRTEIWARSGTDINTLSGVMDAGELVDAALNGFDRRETITIPPLHDAQKWTDYDLARQSMLPGISQEHPADRYLQDAQ